jgi:prefoldin subunit 5
MKMSKLLGWTAAVSMLVLAGPAMADNEPGSVTNYKSKVAGAITVWAAQMDQDERNLHKIAEEWHAIKDNMSKVVATIQHLEKEKQGLETARSALEKKRDDLQKDAAKQVANPVNKGADIVLIRQTTEEIKKKIGEIVHKVEEIKKASEEEKKIGELLAKKKPELAAVEKIAEGHNGAIAAIKLIASPADAKALEKDTKGSYRAEWGPVLQKWIEQQIDAKRQEWSAIGTSARVEWSQSSFASKAGPNVSVTLRMPDVEAKTVSLHMR